MANSKASQQHAPSEPHFDGGILPSTCNPLEARWLSAHYMEINGAICIYEGDLDYGGNMRHGQGITMYPDGFIYAGAFKLNKEHGFGTLTNPAGKVIFEGEWERGKIHGRGTYHYEPSGAVYQGEFSMNLRHGVGVYTFKNGSYYDGDWQNNMRCGRGTMRWQDGSIFEGQWRSNERNGQGTLKASDGKALTVYQMNFISKHVIIDNRISFSYFELTLYFNYFLRIFLRRTVG